MYPVNFCPFLKRSREEDRAQRRSSRSATQYIQGDGEPDGQGIIGVGGIDPTNSAIALGNNNIRVPPPVNPQAVPPEVLEPVVDQDIYKDAKSLGTEKFSDEENPLKALEWLSDYRHKAHVLIWTVERAVRVFPFVLGPNTIDWYYGLDINVRNNYEGLITQFMERFISGTWYQRQIVRDYFFTTQQRTNESTKDFACRVRNIAKIIDLEHEPTILGKFIISIKPEVRSKIWLHKPKTWQTALEMADGVTLNDNPEELMVGKSEIDNDRVLKISTTKAQTRSEQAQLRLDQDQLQPPQQVTTYEPEVTEVCSTQANQRSDIITTFHGGNSLSGITTCKVGETFSSAEAQFAFIKAILAGRTELAMKIADCKDMFKVKKLARRIPEMPEFIQ